MSLKYEPASESILHPKQTGDARADIEVEDVRVAVGEMSRAAKSHRLCRRRGALLLTGWSTGKLCSVSNAFESPKRRVNCSEHPKVFDFLAYWWGLR